MRFILTALAAAIISTLVPTPNASAAPADRLVIVAVGDSLTEGAGAGPGDSYPDQLQARCGDACRVINRGRGGACIITAGCMDPVTSTDTFYRDVILRRPDVVIIGGGRNDLCHGPVRTLIDAYRSLRSQARAVGTEVRFATLTPAGRAWQWPCEEQRHEVNAWMRRQPGTLDFERAVRSRNDMLRAAVDFDGLHMNAAGYRRVANVAYDSLMK